jgi:hypothetical protein
MTLAQMIARLTRGYIKETGRQPVGLDKLRIKMEAAEKLRQMNKIIQFPQKRNFKQEVDDMIKDGTIKMGGVTKQSDKVKTRQMFKDSNLNKPRSVKTEDQIKTEIETQNKQSVKNLQMQKMLDDAIDDASPGFADGDTKYDAELVAENLAEKMGLVYDDLPTKQRLDLYDQAYTGLSKQRFKKPEDPEDFATGGRAEFKGGGLTESDYLKVKDMLNHYKDYKKGGGTMSKKKFGIAFFRENNADGGVAGLLGERTGFRGGGRYQGGSGAPGSAESSSKSKSSTNQGPAGGASAGGNYGGNVNPNQTYGGGGGGNNNTGGGGGPPGTNTSGGGTTTTTTGTQPPSVREIVRQKQIIERLKSLGLIVDEEDLALGAGPTVLGTILKEGVKGVKPKIGKKGLGLEYLKEMDPYGNSLKFNLGTEYKDLLKGELKPKLELKGTKGALEYGFGMDKDKNINFGIKMPTNLFNKPKSKTRNFQERFAPDISKFNFEDLTGIPSQAPTNMQMAKVYGAPELTEFGATPGMFKDTAKFNDMEKYQEIANKQFKMGKEPSAIRDSIKIGSSLYGIDMDNIPKDFLETKEDFKNQKILGDIEFAKGGIARQNFAMGRRAFLKMLAGTGAGIAGLKSGLIGTGGKSATKKAVTETVKSAGSGTPPPYFFKLVDKIKTMGDNVTAKTATQERQQVTRYKDFELTEDVATGEQTIQRIKIDDGNPQYYDETLAEDVYMNYKPGKGQSDEATGRVADEYTEDTSYLRTSGPQKGEIYDTVDGVPDEVVQEGTMFEDNMTEFGKTKKASGGIARMLGE